MNAAELQAYYCEAYCPFCFAPPSEPCRDTWLRPYQVHSARRERRNAMQYEADRFKPGPLKRP